MDYLSRMCIGCLTSFSEGFSNAVMEYMAVGSPVVVTDVGGNRDAIVDGETGYLVREWTQRPLRSRCFTCCGTKTCGSRWDLQASNAARNTSR